MKKVIQFLSGKKTYIVGGLMIILGLLTGDNQQILGGIGLITLRLGISKPNGSKPSEPSESQE